MFRATELRRQQREELNEVIYRNNLFMMQTISLLVALCMTIKTFFRVVRAVDFTISLEISIIGKLRF